MEAKESEVYCLGSVLNSSACQYMQHFHNLETNKLLINAQTTPTILSPVNMSITTQSSINNDCSNDQGWISQIPDIQTTATSVIPITNEIQPWIVSLPDVSITATGGDKMQPCVISNAILKTALKPTELPLVKLEEMNKKQCWSLTTPRCAESSRTVHLGKEQSWTSPTVSISTTTAMNVSRSDQRWNSPNSSVAVSVAGNQASSDSNKQRIWICEICSFAFKYKNNMLEHVRFFHMKGSVPCSKCNKVFPTSRHLRIHRKNHSQEAGQCPHCRLVFPNSHNNPDLYQKEYRHHLPECRRCPASISNTLGRSPNNFINLGDAEQSSVWRCLVCCNSFADLVEYESHACEGQEMADYSLTKDSDFCEGGGSLAVNPIIYDVSILPDPDSPSYKSISDSDFLCIICGVNFENEDQLNLHLYESHQETDQETEKGQTKCAEEPSQVQDEVTKVVYVCKFCKMGFAERQVMKIHQVDCKMKIAQSKETTKVSGNVFGEQDPAGTPNSDVLVRWVCKYCKVFFSDKSEMQIHKKRCAEGRNSASTPEITTTTFLWSCHYCKRSFDDENVMLVHEQQCRQAKEVLTEPNSRASEVIVQWVCKYCKSYFPNKEEMRSHKRACNIRHKPRSGDWKEDVLVKWICKYCKKKFDKREIMILHKINCSLRNKDKSVLSSTESDMSEVVPKEINSSKHLEASLSSSVVGSVEGELIGVISGGKAGDPLDKQMNRTETRDGGQTTNTIDEIGNKTDKEEVPTTRDFGENRTGMGSYDKEAPPATSENAGIRNGVVTTDKEEVSTCNSDENRNEMVTNDREEESGTCDVQENSNGIGTSDKGEVPVTSGTDNKEDVPASSGTNKNEMENGSFDKDVPDSNVESMYEVEIEVLATSDTDSNGKEIKSNEKDDPTSNSDQSNNEMETGDKEEIAANSDTDGNEIETNDKDVFLASDSDDNINEMEANEEVLTTSDSCVNVTETETDEKDIPLPKLKIKIKFNHKCNVCGKGFALRKLMKKHKLESHMYRCQKCSRCFGNNNLLWKHSRICRTQKVSENHEPKKIHTCKKCFRIFRERYKYQIHKGACVHTSLIEDNNNHCPTLPGQRHLLRIHCHKCDHSYTGNDIFDIHSCEKPENVDAFLDCMCGMTHFSSVLEFYTHWNQCSNTDLSDTSCDSPLKTRPARLLCQVCRRQFDSVIFYYHHLKTRTSCRRQPIQDTSDSTGAVNVAHSDSEPSRDENGHWTCLSCQHIYPSYMSKSDHYQSCKSNDSKGVPKESKPPFDCVWSCESNRISYNHSCEQMLKHMTSVQVSLQRLRLPSHLVQKLDGSTQDDVNEDDEIPEEVIMKPTSVQKCVWCHRKCRYKGVGLPPIGQLACFLCRAKLFRKDLKKKGENFYSRAVFSEEEYYPVGQLNVETATGFVYLDPSKRLKVARALAKEKKSNHEISSPHVPLKWKTFELLKQLPVTQTQDKQLPNTLVEKCAHCKRGFVSKEMLQKHVQVSKTCRLGDKGQSKFTDDESLSNSVISDSDGSSLKGGHSQSGSITTSVSSGRSLMSSLFEGNGRSASSLQNGESSSFNGLDLTDDLTYSHQNSEAKNAAKILSPNVTSTTSSKQLGDMISKRGFLVLQDLDKVLRSHPEVKRVRTSPALQCDGWILRPQDYARGDERVKYICGACYKSFSQNRTLVDHIATVHNRPANLVTKLNIMKHIPDELLNNMSW